MLTEAHAFRWIYITLKGFHMSNSQSKDSQFVGFSGERATRGYHVAKLIYIGGHLGSPASFYLTMALPKNELKKRLQINGMKKGLPRNDKWNTTKVIKMQHLTETWF